MVREGWLGGLIWGNNGSRKIDRGSRRVKKAMKFYIRLEPLGVHVVVSM